MSHNEQQHTIDMVHPKSHNDVNAFVTAFAFMSVIAVDHVIAAAGYGGIAIHHPGSVIAARPAPIMAGAWLQMIVMTSGFGGFRY